MQSFDIQKWRKELILEGSSILTEEKISIGGVSYVVSHSKKGDGLYLHFIPQNEPLEQSSKKDAAEAISTFVSGESPILGQALEYDADSEASGLTFYINGFRIVSGLTQGKINEDSKVFNDWPTPSTMLIVYIEGTNRIHTVKLLDENDKELKSLGAAHFAYTNTNDYLKSMGLNITVPNNPGWEGDTPEAKKFTEELGRKGIKVVFEEKDVS